MEEAKKNKVLKAIGVNIEDCDDSVYLDGIIRHPFYCGFLYDSPKFIEHVKKMIEYRKEKAAFYLKEKDYDSYVFLHERPFRLEKFLHIQHKSLKNKGELYTGNIVSRVWIDSENPNINIIVWISLFKRYGENLMTKKEQSFFDSLPETFDLYHGDEGEDDAGISWTLDKKVAEFFAKRFTDDMRKVIKVTAKKSECLCYLNGRSEEEIIILRK